MRRADLAIGVAALLLPAVIQGQSPLRRSLRDESYFPLSAGYRWTYVRTPSVGAPGAFTVTGSVPAAGRGWGRDAVLLTGYFPGVPHTVRSSGMGTVTEQVPATRGLLWYTLGSPVGSSWTLELTPSPLASPLPGDECLRGARLTITGRDETVTVPAGTFRHAVRVDWSTACADAGILSEWFAPGVGLVRREETSFAGPVTSELVAADLEGPLPAMPLSTSLYLDRAAYVNDLLPPVDVSKAAMAAGVFTVQQGSGSPGELAFSGCPSAAIEVLDSNGAVVAKADATPEGCCACTTSQSARIEPGGLVIPFRIALASPDGVPLPAGTYAVRATLETGEAEPLLFSARVRIDVLSVH